LLIFFEIYTQKVKILARESCVWGGKNKIYMQKVEISVRESCVQVVKLTRLTPTQKKGCAPPKGAPVFFKDTYYIAPANQDKKSFFYLLPR
jgi:hypothetical protein